MELDEKDREEILSLLIFKEMLKKQRGEKNDEQERKTESNESVL